MPSRKKCSAGVSRQVIYCELLPFRPAAELWAKVQKRVSISLLVKPLSVKQEAVIRAVQVISGLGLVSRNRRLEISVQEVSTGGIEVEFGCLELVGKGKRFFLENLQIKNICTVHVLKDEFRVKWTKEAYSCLPKNDVAIAVDQKYCKAALIGLLMDFYKHEDEDHFQIYIQTKSENPELWLPPGVAKVQVFNGNLLLDSAAWKNKVELLLDPKLVIIGGASTYDNSY